MVISTQLLRETEQRFREREGERAEFLERIETEGVLQANAPELVQRRLERIARAEAPAGTPAVGVVTVAPGAPFAVPDALSVALERIIGKSDLISVNYLELGMAVSRTVGLVHVRTATGRTKSRGTGFMVSPRLLLTNNHVLKSAREASNSWVEFNFQDDREGRLVSSVVFALEPEAFFLTDARLDYSLVAVAGASRDGGASLGQFGWNRLIEEQGKAVIGEHVNIVQHPNGEPKQLALRENRIVDELENFLHYETDTAPGSSGSPVFNDQWEVIALHHSGVPKKDEQGRILTREGTVWSEDMGEQRIDWIANEGARVSRVLRHIKRQNLPANAQQRLRNEMFEAEPSVVPSEQEFTTHPANSGALSTPSIGADGSAVWTLPLRISVHLGQHVAPPAVPKDGATRLGGGQPAQPMSVRSGAEPVDVSAEPEEDDEELREALAELEDARSRPYYDEEKDREDRDEYYGALTPANLKKAEFFDRLSELLTRTHAPLLKYRPTTHVYPWVDLRPNRKLQSVYSGRELEPEELIREDLRIDRERGLRLQEFVSTESAIKGDRLAQELDLLEESLPFNCEHVVPQSWYDKREPMKGDLHHLFACEPDCNSFRGNIPYFDFADFEEVVREECGKREEGKFEPGAGKGAVARATLYFLLRYPKEINRTSREYEPERLQTLLDWHGAEPVADYERHRNAAIFEKQGNRNPLIDFPEWASEIDFHRGLG